MERRANVQSARRSFTASGARTSRQVSGPFRNNGRQPAVADPDAAGDHGVCFAGRHSRDHVCTLGTCEDDVIQLGPLTR
jgi:hypothetical protein